MNSFGQVFRQHYQHDHQYHHHHGNSNDSSSNVNCGYRGAGKADRRMEVVPILDGCVVLADDFLGSFVLPVEVVEGGWEARRTRFKERTEAPVRLLTQPVAAATSPSRGAATLSGVG